MNRPAKMLAVAAVTLAVGLTAFPGLYGRPPSLEWGPPEPIDIFLPYVLDVKALIVGDVEYLFVIQPHSSDSDALTDECEIMVTHRVPGGWANPTRVPLIVTDPFECAYDRSTGEFLFFSLDTSWTWPTDTGSIHLARGNLTGPWSRETVVTVNLHPGVTGPYDMSAVVADDGTIDLFYCYVTGMTENLNLLYHTRYDGHGWSEPENMGVGNSPAAIRWSGGELQLYSNLWTELFGRQYCVDEWSVRNGSWNRTSLTTSAQSCSVEPFAFEDAKGNGYLVYNHQDDRESASTDLLIQTRPPGGQWGRYVKIASGTQGYYDYTMVYHYGIEHPCATIHGDDLNVYYTSQGDVYTVHGRFR
jgi:hypothetical protein